MGVKVVAGSDIQKYVEGLIDEATQVAGKRIDLTVKQIYMQEAAGALDFGGSEFEEAPRTEIETQKAAPEDKHGWWILDEGRYLLSFNETVKVPSGCMGLITPHGRATINGLDHSVVVLVEKEEMPVVGFSVGERGIRIKENARVSTLMLLD